MKYLLVLLFLCGVSSADSIDYFTLGGPNGNSGLLYSFSLPSNPTPDGFYHDGADGFTLRDVPVTLSQGGVTIPGPFGDATVPFRIDFFNIGNDFRFEMSCGLATAFWDYCYIQTMESFDGPLFSGDVSAPVFILGDHDGKLQIADSVAVPEGSEWAMLGIAGLILIAAVQKRRQILTH